jgi:hypothetical protein
MTGVLETQAVGLARSGFDIWAKLHRDPPAIWLDYISSNQPWHKDQIVLRCDGPGMAVDLRVGDFLANDIVWHRRIGIQSLAAGESKTVEAQFTHTPPNGHEVGYMWRVMRGKREVELPVSFCDLRGAEYTRIFILRQEANTTSAVSVSLGKLTRRLRGWEGLKTWFKSKPAPSARPVAHFCKSSR